MTAPTAATTGTPSVAAMSIEFPRLVLASSPRPARKQAVHTLAH